MSDCCDPISYRRFFNSKEAARRIKNYRKRGLDPRATEMVEFLSSQEITNLDVLEIGGGIGDLQVELLKVGAGNAVNIELSAAYEKVAVQLAEDEGLSDRMSRQFGDFVELQDALEKTDIVVLNRVVCCYPYMDRMMTAAVAKTGKYLAVVFPQEKWWVKAGLGVGNGWMKLRGCGFRSFVHPVDQIEKVATGAGLVVRHRSNDSIWQAVVFEKAA